MSKMMTDVEKQFKKVAMYLRKSRGDEDKDLINHQIKLDELATTYDWSYEKYHEIGSGGSIDDRPEMLKLLKDIEQGMFDAVLVMDYDRLVRGSGADAERFLHTLRMTDTKIITASPYDVLDINNESDADMINMKGFFAGYELRTITKRLRVGRMIGAQRGNWVFGKAPFGYNYNKETKGLVADSEQSAVVRRIATEFLEGKSSGDIAWGLNKDGILSSTGCLWSYGMITKLLRRDVYQGKIVYNRSTGNNQTKNKYHANPFRNNPKDEWKTAYNTHEALISEEERERIEDIFRNYNGRKRAKIAPDGSVFDLSGIVRNSQGMRYTRKFEPSGKESLVLSIDMRTPKEELPAHKSVDPTIVRQAIAKSIQTIESQLEHNLENQDNTKELDSYQKQLKELTARHNIILDSYERIIEGYTGGLYSMDKAKELKQEKEKEQGEVEYQLRQTRHKIDTFSNSKNVDRLERIRQFEDDIKNASSNREINNLYKSILKDVVVDRTTRDKIKVSVNFL